jgi:hypothetical protein
MYLSRSDRRAMTPSEKVRLQKYLESWPKGLNAARRQGHQAEAQFTAHVTARLTHMRGILERRKQDLGLE